MTCPINLQWIAAYRTPRTVAETDMLWGVILGAERRGFLALERIDHGAVVTLTEAGLELLGDGA